MLWIRNTTAWVLYRRPSASALHMELGCEHCPLLMKGSVCIYNQHSSLDTSASMQTVGLPRWLTMRWAELIVILTMQVAAQVETLPSLSLSLCHFMAWAGVQLQHQLDMFCNWTHWWCSLAHTAVECNNQNTISVSLPTHRIPFRPHTPQAKLLFEKRKKKRPYT